MLNRFLRASLAGLTLGVTVAAAVPPTVFADTVSYQIVTDEITANRDLGLKQEVYRFDPAVYVAHVGDEVELHIRGLKGHDHPIMLEGYNLRDVVHRDSTTTMRFRADKAGFFRLICTTHADEQHEGPMEGYLIVLPGKV